MFLLYMLFMILTFTYFTFYRMMAVILTPSPHLAAVVSSAFYSFWKLLSGFLVPKPDGGYGLIWLLQFCCIVTIDLHFFSHRWSPLTKFESTSPSVCINMADSQVLELEEPPTQWRNLSKNFEFISPYLKL
ncbi:hypothetical protein GIB67_009699 [Kingdonia uniflora]|uniref:Uncharacterized protein n=1 Tax=Kingdonia uniflora TaxID=39325 RepID=A0A7J7LBD1_9MAGN|nr:hypothetical protein GIB67_009699 [Kingdonia uniflora]